MAPPAPTGLKYATTALHCHIAPTSAEGIFTIYVKGATKHLVFQVIINVPILTGTFQNLGFELVFP